ncbi:acetate/propionate family kinase [Halomonas cerina]|uniref:Acetate kinase n=1 Tax=Halomonas cerina TaxID=447424 RepID=A0A839V8R7_9GAMM|nr:acetate/propionate family kinase [Halomonas cerina]MBB3190438.1 acetate kinase [Halomonas cerina]
MGDILVLNSGSSSLKFALYTRSPAHHRPASDALGRRYRGQFSGLGDSRGAARFALHDADDRPIEVPELATLPERLDRQAALERLLDWIERTPDLDELAAVGHRVVHGGRHYRDPVVVDEAILGELEGLNALAPLHQPFGLAPIRRLAERHPGLPQVACFDTAFHARQADVARHFALPRELTRRGLIRYGFHGLSYDYLSRELPRVLGQPRTGRVVAAHLGNGASLCAMHDGQSVASTMGFTAIEGLPMGTRSGSLDPGLVLHLIRQEGMAPADVEEMLYKRSGLLGVSGLSGDMHELLTSSAPEAREAVELFVYRIVREIGSLAAALGGLDHLVFTAGIGEHAAPVRDAVCRGCAWLGLTLDDAANQHHATRISRDDSRVGAWVIPTDEERMIAQYCAGLITEPAGSF